ncbi:hypothetical protein MIND_00567200 [Mycena indigotica]|uniref:Uncharacterized protein n=1 Tax=Mycena indigotica TaxID=2126181 RepID=A0A8H6SQW4_9AGAR|nr:uncharacterized protein MIND_00567200 [Mycena indigotica]KAF7303390.1 hypothetical protein MIND_00567200 [Mycena indigotica]
MAPHQHQHQHQHHPRSPVSMYVAHDTPCRPALPPRPLPKLARKTPGPAGNTETATTPICAFFRLRRTKSSAASMSPSSTSPVAPPLPRLNKPLPPFPSCEEWVGRSRRCPQAPPIDFDVLDDVLEAITFAKPESNCPADEERCNEPPELTFAHPDLPVLGEKMLLQVRDNDDIDTVVRRTNNDNTLPDM